jgi:hypothetical protein
MARRTKSCTVCRQKRIKCDATLPQCLMCVRFGRKCQGLDDGPLMVDMNARAPYGMQKRIKKCSGESSPRELHTWAHAVYVDRISHQAVVTEAFYGRFLSYFTSEGEGKDIRNKMTWLHQLPQLSVDGTNEALTLAVQATAFSYCALESQDLALTRHAWGLYGHAITMQGRLLARRLRLAVGAVTLHMISTSVLFSFFEAMQATNAEAYRLHVYGSAKMFEIADPRDCYEGILCQLFFHIRTQLAFVQLTSSERDTSIDAKRIMYDVLDYDELPIFQRVSAHFTQLADAYSKMDSDGTTAKAQQIGTHEEPTTVKNEIDSLWEEYTGTATLNNELLIWYDTGTDTSQYRDAFTALTIAYFSATRILLTVTGPRPATYSTDLADHCQSVLRASLYMQTCLIGCAYMRMAAPLLLVALHAPEARQRQIAIGCFQSWEYGSMRGISELALDTIRRRPLAMEQPELLQPRMNATHNAEQAEGRHFGELRGMAW